MIGLAGCTSTSSDERAEAERAEAEPAPHPAAAAYVVALDVYIEQAFDFPVDRSTRGCMAEAAVTALPPAFWEDQGIEPGDLVDPDGLMIWALLDDPIETPVLDAVLDDWHGCLDATDLRQIVLDESAWLLGDEAGLVESHYATCMTEPDIVDALLTALLAEPLDGFDLADPLRCIDVDFAVAVFTTQFRREGLDHDEARCAAQAVVEAIGLDRFVETLVAVLDFDDPEESDPGSADEVRELLEEFGRAVGESLRACGAGFGPDGPFAQIPA